MNNTEGSYNSFLGYGAGRKADGSRNVFIGAFSGENDSTGVRNTFVGVNSEINNNGDRNVFLGYTAGATETGSDKLYIANSNTTSPLIWGDFATQEVKISGTLEATSSVTAASFIGDGSNLSGIDTTDNLGDHVATQNVQLNGNWISNDGEDEGISLQNDGDLVVKGTISSNQTSVYWFSGHDLILNGNSADEADIKYSVEHISRTYRKNTSGTTTVYLPLTGIPKSVFGHQVKITTIKVFYRVNPGCIINTTTVYEQETSIASEIYPHSSTTTDSFDVTFSIPYSISGPIFIAFDSFHDGSGTSHSIYIRKVKVEVEY